MPDGGVIAASLLGLISDHMSYLIEAGRVYVVQTPIYKQDGRFIYADDDIDKLLNKNKPFIRYKGLGEISGVDAESVFFNENTRRLIRVTMEGSENALDLIDRTNPDSRRNLMIKSGILVDELA